jgi:DNA-binding CsgD family transcriptional regulator
MENTLKLTFVRISNRVAIKFGLITSLIVVLFQLANHLVIYNYLKLDYYLSFVALVFLIIGMFLKEKNEIVKEVSVEIVKEVFVSSVFDSTNNLNKLTNKELQILKLIIEGKSNKEIAELNFVEMSTIKTHINNLYTKLSVKNRKEASLIYIDLIQEGQK